MDEKSTLLKNLKIQQVQPKGGINLYTSNTSGKGKSLPKDATFFQKFFNEGSYQEPSLSKRINTVYQFTDAYTEELFALTQAGTEPATGALKDQAMRNAQSKLSRTKKEFAIPLNEYREVLGNSEFFLETRGFWNEVTTNVDLFENKQPYPGKLKRQNIFIKGVAEELSTAMSKGEIQSEYRGKAIKRYRSPLSSQKGEMTYFNLESKDVFGQKFIQDVFGDPKKGTSLSKSMLNLDSYFNNIGGTFDQAALTEIRAKIAREAAPFGVMDSSLVRPDILEAQTKEELVNLAFKAAQGDDANIVSAIPGKVLHGAASDGTLQNHRYANNLTSNNSKFFKNITKRQERRAKEQVSSKSLSKVFDSFEDSQTVLEPIKRASRSLDEMSEYVSRTQKVFGFNGNPGQEVIQKTNHRERIQQLAHNFEKAGYNVSLDYSKDSDSLLFNFATKDSGIDFGSMTLTQKMANENIGRVVLPLEDSSYLTNIQGNKVHSKLHLSFEGDINLVDRKANRLKMRRTSDIAYDELDNLPDFIRRQRDSARNKGKSDGEILQQATSYYQNEMMKRATPAEYSGIDVGSGYKTSSKHKNFAASSVVDTGDFVEEHFRQNYPESYAKFDDYRKAKGSPKLRFVDDNEFIDNDWVNPYTGSKESMNMKMHVISEGAMRFNEMYGSDQMGLHLTSYGLNANQVRGGNYVIGDWRDLTSAGEMNRATREQILKTLNYAPMERDMMSDYLTSFYGEEMGSRYANPIVRVGTEGVEAALVSDNELSKAYGRTVFTNDSELAEATQKVEAQLRKEITEIDAEINTTSNEAKKLRLMSRKEQLESGISELKRGSVYEDQTIVRKSWADKAQVRTQFQKALDEGYELPAELINELREQQPELFDEVGKLKAGNYDVNIGQHDLEKMGLVDRRNKVTVGTLNREYAVEHGVSTSEEISKQSQLFYKNSTINQILVDNDGNISLGINQVQRLDDGTKLIGGESGTRTTATVWSDFIYDRVEKEMGTPGKTTFMREHLNIGRGPQGGMLNTLIDTSYFNAMEDMGNVLIQNPDGSYRVDASKSTTGSVRRWAENVGNLPGGREAYERDFLENEFIANINSAGYDGMVVLPEKGTQIMINETSVYNKALEGLSSDEYVKANKQRYDALYDYSTKDLGFDERYAATALSIHDVPRWQGEKGPRYADREGRILSMITNKHLGDNSALSSQINAMRDTGTATAHRGYAKEVIKNLQVFEQAGQDIRDYQGQSNVIFDFSGNFKGDSNVIQRVAEDGSNYFVVDGLSIPRAQGVGTMKTGAETIRSLDDLMSIQMGDVEGFAETYTVQNLIRDSKSQAVIQLPQGQYSKDVLPVYSYFGEDYEQNSILYKRDMNRGQADVVNALVTMKEMSIDGGYQNGSFAYQRGVIERGIGQMQDGGNAYLTGKGKSDFIKSQFALENKHGFSGVLGGYNIETDFLKENEFGVSREMAEHMISGNEDNILRANNIDPSQIKDKKDFILSKMTGASDPDDEFSFIASYNRYPTQSQGSIQFGAVRIDEALEGTDRLMIGRYVAGQSGADFDGDTGYLLGDYYTEKRKDGPTNFRNIQKDLITMSDISQETIKEMSDIVLPTDSFSYARSTGYNDDEIYDLFSKFRGAPEEALDIVAKSTQVPGIGYIDNELVAGRGLVVDTFNAMYEAGSFGQGEEARATMNSWIDRYDQGSDKLVQGYISAKKLTPELLDVRDETGEISRLFSDMDIDEQLERLHTVTGQRTALPDSLHKLTPDTMDEIIGNWMQASAIDASEFDTFKEYMMPLAIANEATRSNKGSRNTAFKLGRGTGTEIINIFDQIQNDPMSISDTSEVMALGNMHFGEDSDVMTNFKSAQAARRQQVAARAENLISRSASRERVTSTSEISSSIMHNLNIAEGMQDMSQTARRVTSQNEAFNTAKSFVSSTANSTAFKVGAGAAAMWMISSSLRDGPTPEGNEAQQEASQAEVNPSALLTSPTARVTPNAENVNLMISGRGNIDQSAVAGLVNNEINGMIGTQMEMNVNVTDNTRRLDRSFYEKQVNSVLGI